MVEEVKMDKQGRITIPAQIRNLLSLAENTIMEMEVQANEIVIRKRDTADPEKIKVWFKKLNEMSSPANPEQIEPQDSKWYSEEYVKRKLGL